jgi:uncharacterized protein with HEPN domain
MEHDETIYVAHMKDLAEKAVDKIAGKTRSGFDADENLRLALTHLLQNIGEAARKVPLTLPRRSILKSPGKASWA